MIYITEKAALKIKETAISEAVGHFNIRVKVIGGGCSGMQFDMYFEDNITDMDEITEFDGIQLVVDPLSFQYMDEICCDYVETVAGAGFKFRDGKIKSTCGCGSSIAF